MLLLGSACELKDRPKTMLLKFLRLIVLTFFREIVIKGQDNLPQSGPVIFTPNHHSHIDTGLMIRSIPPCWRTELVIAAASPDQLEIEYREALLLRPGDHAAKWNLELATRQRPPDQSSSGSGAGQGGSGREQEPQPPQSRLDRSQAEQILNSMSEEERRTLLARNQRRRQSRETRGRKDW